MRSSASSRRSVRSSPTFCQAAKWRRFPAADAAFDDAAKLGPAGLDLLFARSRWSIPGRFQELRRRKKVAQELRKAARSGDLGRFFGKAADLRTRLTIAEAHAKRLRSQLETFEVVPEYKALEQEANEITRATSTA